jgi:hypothetical protein
LVPQFGPPGPNSASKHVPHGVAVPVVDGDVVVASDVAEVEVASVVDVEDEAVADVEVVDVEVVDVDDAALDVPSW